MNEQEEKIRFILSLLKDLQASYSPPVADLWQGGIGVGMKDYAPPPVDDLWQGGVGMKDY